MKPLAALLILIAGLLAQASASDYTLENRPTLAFPTPRGEALRVSPYPMSERAAAVWKSDACWRECAMRRCAWKMETCVGAVGPNACQPGLDACDRACLRDCRMGGGPVFNILD